MNRVTLEPVQLMQQNMLAYFRLFAGLPGITHHDAEIFWLVSASGEPGNQILRTQFASHTAEQQIDAALAQIGQHTNQLDWMVFPGCQPADLGQRLQVRGMASSLAGTWMLTELPVGASTLATPAQFRVERVTDLGMLAAWREISTAGFGGDVQIHVDAYARHGFGPAAYSLHYIGYLGHEPVTSATLLLAGGIAGIWDVSTPPALRGRGFGSAITLHLLHEAHAHGYRQAWVWSSNMGKRVYQRVGFIAADFGVREYAWRKN